MCMFSILSTCSVLVLQSHSILLLHLSVILCILFSIHSLNWISHLTILKFFLALSLSLSFYVLSLDLNQTHLVDNLFWIEIEISFKKMITWSSPIWYWTCFQNCLVAYSFFSLSIIFLMWVLRMLKEKKKNYQNKKRNRKK